MESGCNGKKTEATREVERGTEWFEAKVRFGRFGKPINSPAHLFNVNPGCR